MCVGPQLLLYGTHRSICLSSQVCLAQTQASPLLLSLSICLTPTTLFIDLVLAHSFPLDIVFLSYHLLDASLSLYPSPRAPFSSNTHMHVYRSISQHIPRSTLTIPPIDRRTSQVMSLLSLTKGDWSSYVVTSAYHSHIVPPHHSCMPPDSSLTRTCTDNKQPSPLLLILQACPLFV